MSCEGLPGQDGPEPPGLALESGLNESLGVEKGNAEFAHFKSTGDGEGHRMTPQGARPGLHPEPSSAQGC